MKKISGDFRFFRCKKIRVQCSVSRIQRGSRIRIQFFGNVEALIYNDVIQYSHVLLRARNFQKIPPIHEGFVFT